MLMAIMVVGYLVLGGLFGLYIWKEIEKEARVLAWFEEERIALREQGDMDELRATQASHRDYESKMYFSHVRELDGYFSANYIKAIVAIATTIFWFPAIVYSLLKKSKSQ
jgi:hypothetical protein